LIRLINIFGNPNIGVYTFTNDILCLIPEKLSKKMIALFSNTLNVSTHRISISNSRIIGILTAGNNKGILLPKIVDKREVDKLKKIIKDLNIDIQVEVLPSELTALGNNILINDKAAIINPDFESNIEELIRDTCQIDEIIKRRIAGSKLVGSNALVTNKGLLVSPDASLDELEFLGNYFDVNCDIGTVNKGVGLVGSSGLVCNVYGALVGRETTGPELQRIFSVFNI